MVHHHLSRERDNGHHPKGRTEGLTARRLCRFTSGRSQGRAHTCPARRSPHQNKARRGTPGKAERGPPALQRVCGQAPTGARFPVTLQTLEHQGTHQTLGSCRSTETQRTPAEKWGTFPTRPPLPATGNTRPRRVGRAENDTYTGIGGGCQKKGGSNSSYQTMKC